MAANVDKHTPELQHVLACAENIIATLRQPFVVLDKSLRVRTANAAFYRDFYASKEETEGRLLIRLGQRPVGHPLFADAAAPSPEQQPYR